MAKGCASGGAFDRTHTRRAGAARSRLGQVSRARPDAPYSKNHFAYNWHWFWDTGNGDIGNQGVHEMDIALGGLNATVGRRR